MGNFTTDGNTLSATGELDTRHIAAFDAAVEGLIGATEGDLTLDFSEVERMTSTFLPLIMSLRSRLADERRSLVLRPSPAVRSLLSLTGLDSQITMRD